MKRALLSLLGASVILTGCSATNDDDSTTDGPSPRDRFVAAMTYEGIVSSSMDARIIHEDLCSSDDSQKAAYLVSWFGDSARIAYTLSILEETGCGK